MALNIYVRLRRYHLKRHPIGPSRKRSKRPDEAGDDDRERRQRPPQSEPFEPVREGLVVGVTVRRVVVGTAAVAPRVVVAGRPRGRAVRRGRRGSLGRVHPVPGTRRGRLGRGRFAVAVSSAVARVARRWVARLGRGAVSRSASGVERRFVRRRGRRRLVVHETRGRRAAADDGTELIHLYSSRMQGGTESRRRGRPERRPPRLRSAVRRSRGPRRGGARPPRRRRPRRTPGASAPSRTGARAATTRSPAGA